jgi:PleD family two-component response regulator
LTQTGSHLKPLILIATNEGHLAHALRNALADADYRILTASDERQALDHAQTHRPHAIIVDASLAPPGFGLCTTLRTVALATPIVLTGPGPVTRANQLEAMRAGAWDMRGAPLDTEELLLRLGLYVEAKIELDRLSAECLVDNVSGLYNPVGLVRRADELGALATRAGLALACAVFRPAQHLPNIAAADRLAQAFKVTGRTSDAIGRTGHAEFAVYAPATNTWAASRLVRRVSDSVEREFGYLAEQGRRVTMRAGYSASQDAHKISPPTLLARARSALEASGSSR